MNNDKENCQKTVGNEKIINSKCGKLLVNKIDYNLSLNEHATSLAKKVSQKLNAPNRIVFSITFDQIR